MKGRSNPNKNQCQIKNQKLIKKVSFIVVLMESNFT